MHERTPAFHALMSSAKSAFLTPTNLFAQFCSLAFSFKLVLETTSHLLYSSNAETVRGNGKALLGPRALELDHH